VGVKRFLSRIGGIEMTEQGFSKRTGELRRKQTLQFKAMKIKNTLTQSAISV